MVKMIRTYSAEEVGATIKRIRLERGLTQKELAKASAINKSNLSLIEKGGTNTSIGVLQRMCVVLGIKLSDFFKRVEDGR